MKPQLVNLMKCQQDSAKYYAQKTEGPAEPKSYSALITKLDAKPRRFPPLYIESVCNPFAETMRKLGQSGYNDILNRDPDRESNAALLFDIAQSILQNESNYQANATDAFEELVTDLFDGFLSAEDRRGVNPPDKGAIPPLVKWGNPADGPYTWPVDAVRSFGVKAPIVNLPPSHGKGCLLGWAALGHETCGHDIIHADTGLPGEIREAVRAQLLKSKLADKNELAAYWSSRIDETASDVMGILNMGPAAGIGMIGYFRGINKVFGNGFHLDNNGAGDDSHPADIVRGYLAAAVVHMLEFTDHADWADVIDEETAKDATAIVLSSTKIPTAAAKQSAQIVAKAIATTPFNALEKNSLISIQNWRDEDEAIVANIRKYYSKNPTALSSQLLQGAYAAHAVSAAVMEGLTNPSVDISLLFSRMIDLLKLMHDRNASWGPLFIAHPGDAVRDFMIAPDRRQFSKSEERKKSGQNR